MSSRANVTKTELTWRGRRKEKQRPNRKFDHWMCPTTFSDISTGVVFRRLQCLSVFVRHNLLLRATQSQFHNDLARCSKDIKVSSSRGDPLAKKNARPTAPSSQKEINVVFGGRRVSCISFFARVISPSPFLPSFSFGVSVPPFLDLWLTPAKMGLEIEEERAAQPNQYYRYSGRLNMGSYKPQV